MEHETTEFPALDRNQLITDEFNHIKPENTDSKMILAGILGLLDYKITHTYI